MIVSEKNVSDALTYLAEDPHPYALALKDLTDAENKSKRVFSEAYLAAGGSVEARKATAEVSTEYQAAKDEEAEAVLELERHRSRKKAAEMLCEIWRTEQSNIRAAERIR